MRKRTAPLAAGVIVAAAVSAAPRPARAQTALADSMQGYYDGELASAYAVTALGVASVATGGVLVTRHGDLARGLGWPLLTIGALEAIGGAGYGWQVKDEIARYGTLLERDPARFRREETLHMHGTTSRFVYYRVVEIGLLVAGAALATYGFATSRPTYEGGGVALAIVAAPIVVIDTFNDARARRYEAAVTPR